ncbi:hypothetical protein C3999_02369 [Escherichia marmotae]|nr:hypothetical protein C3999_02369 [Escherichia marmotae]RDR93800.1 hypothetical protein C3998_02406 [Escherichia marmotae]
MGNAGLGSGTVRAANANVQRSRRPVADIRRRNADAPVAVRQHRCSVSLIINHHRQRRACGKAGAAAGNHLRLTMFDDIDHIIACNGVDSQTWQTGVNGDIARAAAGVANSVGDRGVNG